MFIVIGFEIQILAIGALGLFFNRFDGFRQQAV